LPRSDFQIRLLNAKDGSPHHLPLNNVISWVADMNGEGVNVSCTNMTASRLMIFVSTFAGNILIVWDWRTGQIVRVIDFRLVSTLIPSAVAGP
jgi:hypothetical protein